MVGTSAEFKVAQNVHKTLSEVAASIGSIFIAIKIALFQSFSFGLFLDKELKKVSSLLISPKTS